MPLCRLSLLALALLLACSRPPPPAPAPTPAPEAAPPAPAPTPAAAQPASPPAASGPLTAAALIQDAAVLRSAGDPTPLSADGETVVEPDARFRVALREESRDARLLLLDAADAAVPSAASHEIGDQTHLTLTPSEPLVPGSRYVLRLDGAVERALHVGDQAYAPALYRLRVAGEPPRPLPAPKKHGKAKKARR